MAPKLVTGKNDEGFVLPNYSGLRGALSTVTPLGPNLIDIQSSAGGADMLKILRPGVGGILFENATGTPTILELNIIDGSDTEVPVMHFIALGGSGYNVNDVAFLSGAVGTSKTPTLYVDNRFNRVAVGTNDPTQNFEVSGGFCLSGGAFFFGTKLAAPTVIGSGALFVSGGATSAIELWFREYDGTQGRVYP
jgi:hypothetical protein